MRFVFNNKYFCPGQLVAPLHRFLFLSAYTTLRLSHKDLCLDKWDYVPSDASGDQRFFLAMTAMEARTQAANRADRDCRG
jgi:hypothetical protein